MPGVLVRVGVAEHDLEAVAAQPDELAEAWVVEQLADQGVGRAQLGDGLQQRDEPDARHLRRQVHQPCLARQEHRGEHVVGALGHRDDVGLADRRAVPVQRLADGHERLDRSCGPPRPAGGGVGASGRMLASSALSTLVRSLGTRARRSGTGCSPSRSMSWPSGVMVRAGVLADVEGRQRQAEHRHRAHRAGHRPGRDQAAAVGGQRGADQLQVGQQLAGGPIVPARLVGTVLATAGRGCCAAWRGCTSASAGRAPRR